MRLFRANIIRKIKIKMDTVKHLVLSGGAMKGIAFLGVLECLQRKNALRIGNLQSLAGSSVGAIISCLLVVGYSVAELFKIVVDTDLMSMSEIELSKLLTNFGLCSGHHFVSKLKECYTRKGFNPDVTFKELHNLTGKRLVVTVSCLGKGVRYFDYLSEPDLSVLTAVRMSFSLPLLFTAVKYKGDYYVDGGLLDNIPLAMFANEPCDSVIAIRVSVTEPNMTAQPTAEDFLWLLMTTTLREIERLRLQATRQLHSVSTIVVPAHELKTNSRINLTLSDKQKMFKAGYRAGLTYLAGDAWLTLRVQNLPYEVMRQVWREVHKTHFRSVISSLTVT